MSQSQEVFVDQLVDIIQNIQLARGTGQMRVKRGQGSNTEEGIILFVNGQVTEARVERRIGSGALNWMSTWEACLVTFVPSNPAESAFPTSFSRTNRQTDQVTGKHPTPFQTFPVQRRTSGSLEGGMRNTNDPALSQTVPFPSIVPVPVMQLDVALYVIENKGLTRTHRQLFLLIDGQRPCAELVRLTRRSPEEVERLLHDLERINVIRLANGQQR